MWKVINMNTIILIGYMGSGKSTIGERTAKSLGMEFLDTDVLIEEQEGMTISELFAQKGESYFRQKETETIQKLKEEAKGIVLATGGGLPMREENQKLLKKLGTVVYLKASVDTLVERLKGDITRPLLKEGDLRKKIETMIENRNPIYEKVADVVLETDNKSICEMICCLEQLWRHKDSSEFGIVKLK